MKQQLLYTVILMMTFSNAFGMKILYPDRFEVNAQIVEQEELRAIIETQNGVVRNDLYKKSTARTYSLDSGKFIIELYDRRGIIMSSYEDFLRLDIVSFIKSNIGFLRPRISYSIMINEKEADRIIEQYEGELSEKLKPRYTRFMFTVYQLNNGQVIIRYKDELKIKDEIKQVEESHLYEDIEALSYRNDDFVHILFPNHPELAKEELLNGGSPLKFSTYESGLIPQEVEQLIEVHQLKKIKDGISYYSCSDGTLYQSKNGYFILLEDISHKKQWEFSNTTIPYIFLSLAAFESEYQKMVEDEAYWESIKDLEGINHYYKELSDNYGESFPQHTFEEIKKLPELLNFDSSRLNFTSDCLWILNESMDWNFGDAKFIRDIFYPMLAYAGEYNKHNNKGDWDMRYNSEDKVWEPWFISNDGNEIIDAYRIAVDFFEAEYGIPKADFYIR